MSVLSECTDQTVAADADHQVAQEIPASVAENALEPVHSTERVIALVTVDDAPPPPVVPPLEPLAEPEIDLQSEPKSLEAIPFISHDTSPFENDEVILLDEWFVSRFYDTEAEARTGLNRLFAQTGINFAYGLKVGRQAFYLSDYRYYRYSFNARVGLYAFEESLEGDDLNLSQALESVEADLSYQLSVHHASRTLELTPKRTLEVGHYTLLSLAAGAVLCVAFHGIMNGWLLG
jgi:hypothetical protein